MREIPGYVGYFVSDEGEIFSSKRATDAEGRCLFKMKPYLEKDGYLTVRLRLKDRGTVKRRVHRLVLMASDNRADSMAMECDHVDGNRSNNALSNLEWVMRDENIRRAIARNGGNPKARGELSAVAKLKWLQVNEIRRRYADGGITMRKLANEYGICVMTVCRIIGGTIWVINEKSASHNSV